jgi:hypothetical protein
MLRLHPLISITIVLFSFSKIASCLSISSAYCSLFYRVAKYLACHPGVSATEYVEEWAPTGLLATSKMIGIVIMAIIIMMMIIMTMMLMTSTTIVTFGEEQGTECFC